MTQCHATIDDLYAWTSYASLYEKNEALLRAGWQDDSMSQYEYMRSLPLDQVEVAFIPLEDALRRKEYV
jgi:hypothetical protein